MCIEQVLKMNEKMQDRAKLRKRKQLISYGIYMTKCHNG